MSAQLSLLDVLDRPAPVAAHRATVQAPAPEANSANSGTKDASRGEAGSDAGDATAPPIYREHLERVALDPKRLDKGGDVDKSYSADLICYSSKLRSTFRLNGADWVNTGGMWWAGGRYCECYRVVPLELFDGETTTYQTHNWDQARGSSGYHGMRVKHGSRDVVLVGPSIVVVAGQVEQGALL